MEEGHPNAVQVRSDRGTEHGFAPFQTAQLKMLLPVTAVRATYGG